MAHLAPTIPLSPHADGTQAALRLWLDALARAPQPAARTHAVDPAADAERLADRARILQQAASNMLAPVARQRPVSQLLR